MVCSTDKKKGLFLVLIWQYNLNLKKYIKNGEGGGMGNWLACYARVIHLDMAAKNWITVRQK